MQINRRTALKTIGVTTTALATLNGEALAKTAEPKFPFSYRLGWFGKVKCSEPSTIKRKTLLNARGFEIKPESISWTFISDKGLKSIRSHLCLQKMLIISHPLPKYTCVAFIHDQRILIQSWRENVSVQWFGDNHFRVTCDGIDRRYNKNFQEDLTLIDKNLLAPYWKSGLDFNDENGKILMTIDVLEPEDVISVDYNQSFSVIMPFVMK